MDILMKHDLVAIVVILLSFGAVTAAEMSTSHNHRKYIEKPVIKTVREPDYPLEVWQSQNVLGRILVHYDRELVSKESKFLNLLTDSDVALSRGNYIYLALRQNIIRSIYYIVPESSWNLLENRIREYGKNEFSVIEGRGYLTTIQGLPVHIMRLSDVPSLNIREPVLLNVSGSITTEADRLAIVQTLKSAGIIADIVTLFFTTTGSDQIAGSGVDAYAL